jgi:hypothetical protein
MKDPMRASSLRMSQRRGSKGDQALRKSLRKSRKSQEPADPSLRKSSGSGETPDPSLRKSRGAAENPDPLSHLSAASTLQALQTEQDQALRLSQKRSSGSIWPASPRNSSAENSSYPAPAPLDPVIQFTYRAMTEKAVIRSDRDMASPKVGTVVMGEEVTVRCALHRSVHVMCAKALLTQCGCVLGGILAQ